jgi:hypothetical protein
MQKSLFFRKRHLKIPKTTDLFAVTFEIYLTLPSKNLDKQ